MDKLLLYFYSISDKENIFTMPKTTFISKYFQLSTQTIRNKILEYTKANILTFISEKKYKINYNQIPNIIPKKNLKFLILFFNDIVIDIYLYCIKQILIFNDSFNFNISLLEKEDLKIPKEDIIQIFSILEKNNFLKFSFADDFNNGTCTLPTL